ncbi:MAG: hypothetical protein Q6362_009675 [Candidatus Wukongarchaeota archaeon]|nr:hypothetical protein [Candidatus Wukongarchaeota archaeon]
MSVLPHLYPWDSALCGDALKAGFSVVSSVPARRMQLGVISLFTSQRSAAQRRGTPPPPSSSRCLSSYRRKASPLPRARGGGGLRRSWRKPSKTGT